MATSCELEDISAFFAFQILRSMLLSLSLSAQLWVSGIRYLFEDYGGCLEMFSLVLLLFSISGFLCLQRAYTSLVWISRVVDILGGVDVGAILSASDIRLRVMISGLLSLGAYSSRRLIM